MKGGAGSDELHGNAGSDVLIGGNDIDLIYGGSGTNVLVGGSFTSDAVLMGLASMQLEDIKDLMLLQAYIATRSLHLSINFIC